jgi:hypothetical protein
VNPTGKFEKRVLWNPFLQRSLDSFFALKSLVELQPRPVLLVVTIVVTRTGLLTSVQQKPFAQTQCFCSKPLTFHLRFFSLNSFFPHLVLLCDDNADNPAASAPLPTFPSHPHHHLRRLPGPLREILPGAPGTPSPKAAMVRRIRNGDRP